MLLYSINNVKASSSIPISKAIYTSDNITTYGMVIPSAVR